MGRAEAILLPKGALESPVHDLAPPAKKHRWDIPTESLFIQTQLNIYTALL